MKKAAELATPPAPVVPEEQAPALEEPPGPKTLISLQQLEEIDAAESASDRVERLRSALSVNHYLVNPRTTVWLDFCFGVLNFARDEAHLPSDKTLSLLTLAHEVYDFATRPQPAVEPGPRSTEAESSPDESNEIPEDVQPEESPPSEEFTVKPVPTVTAPVAYPTVEAVYDQFREKIRRASGVATSSAPDPIDEPSSPPAPFSSTEVAQVVSFFTSTFFRHLRAYQFVSRVARPCIVQERPVHVETPLRPAALADAVLST